MMKLQPMMCPRCKKPLSLEKHPLGGLWRCTECSGVAANLAVLHRHLEEDVARDFWRRASQASVPSKRHCPSCSKPLREFVATHEQQSLRLDLCRPCQLMWFDRGEMEVFPKSRKPQSSENATPSEIALPRIHTEPRFGDFMMDENVGQFAYYVEVGLTVILALLRLFR
jgi:Zn-finger nucleic acid-binding protein